MKKVLVIFSAATISLMACNNADNNTSNENKKLDEPSASFDTTQHPNAVTSDAVISTDTAAMNTENARKKLDSVNRKNKE